MKQNAQDQVILLSRIKHRHQPRILFIYSDTPIPSMNKIKRTLFVCDSLACLKTFKNHYPHLSFGLDLRELSPGVDVALLRSLVTFVLIKQEQASKHFIQSMQDAWIQVMVHARPSTQDFLHCLSLHPFAVYGNIKAFSRVLAAIPKKTLVNLPKLIAHRGVPALAMENTLSSFERAVSYQPDALECDIHLTFDKQIVINHDDTLLRLHGIDASIREMHYQKIVSQTSVCSLQTLLRAFPDYKGHFFIEVKPDDNALIQALVSLIESDKLTQKVIVISFHLGLLKYLHSLNRDVKMAWLFDVKKIKRKALNSRIHEVKAIQAGLSLYYKGYNKTIQSFYDLGGQVFVWTVNDEVSMSRFLHKPVSGITTDYVNVYEQYPKALIKKKDNFVLVFSNKTEKVVHPLLCYSNSSMQLYAYLFIQGKIRYTLLCVTPLL